MAACSCSCSDNLPHVSDRGKIGLFGGRREIQEALVAFGRPENRRRNTRIATMLAAGTSYSDIQAAVGCSRATVAKIAKRRKQAA
jgi:DNA invertase Pin-like site-specific DNA recombinase